MKANNPHPDETPAPAPPETTRTTLRIDETGLEGYYANLTRVIAGPEEVIVDFGLAVPSQENPQQQNAKFTDRVVLNYYNAKRLALTLGSTVARYEQSFGTIELDTRKRQILPLGPNDKQ
jgi:hypothetical protein